VRFSCEEYTTLAGHAFIFSDLLTNAEEEGYECFQVLQSRKSADQEEEEEEYFMR